MYIIPNTAIRLIKNCPLDPNYENTIYFSSLAAQTTYFTSTLSGLLFNANSYQRVNKGTLRVAVNAETIYNYNYLAFQNTSFGSRWFYAFIRKIEYVNNVTSEITYELDVLQTWHFSYELEQCFVEREHSVTDAIGDNLVPEKLETGEYIVDKYSEPDCLDPASWDIVLFCTIDDQYNPVDAYWNLYMGSGLFPKTFPNTVAGVTSMATWMSNIPAAMQGKAVVSATLMPHFMTTASQVGSWSDAPVTTMMRSDGTAVRNKKCLTYPYNFLYVTNFQGKYGVYRYEFFHNKLACTFEFYGRVTPDPVFIAVPSAYKLDLPETFANNNNYDEMIELSGFPQIPFNTDAFQAWLAQSASSIAINGMSFVAGMVSGNVPVAAAAATGLAHQAVEGAIASAMPPQSRGGVAGSGKFSTGKLTLGFMNKHITPEFATIIDDYFSMYGYACKQVKTPNRTARPEWNYVKTIGCKIKGIESATGGLPAEDADKIESIYNAGVRFWTNPAHIGDYTQNNAPTI